MKRFLAVLSLAAISFVVNAEEITKPIRYTWIATSCEEWNCALSALVLANGDRNVIVLPTGQNDVPWVVLRRVEEGSVYIPEDEPFTCEVFTSSIPASVRFDEMDKCHGPMMLSVPDGRMIVASLQKCGSTGGGGITKRRAVR